MVANSEGLSPGQLDAWVTMMAFVETVPAAIEGQLKSEAGINLFEYTVLAMVSEEPDQALPMSKLAELSFGSISRLSHAVTRLQRRGWVEKQAGTGERRHNIVSLTAAGQEALGSAAASHVAMVRERVADPLSEDDTRDLARILRKLIAVTDPRLAELLDQQIPVIIDRNQK